MSDSTISVGSLEVSQADYETLLKRSKISSKISATDSEQSITIDYDLLEQSPAMVDTFALASLFEHVEVIALFRRSFPLFAKQRILDYIYSLDELKTRFYRQQKDDKVKLTLAQVLDKLTAEDRVKIKAFASTYRFEATEARESKVKLLERENDSLKDQIAVLPGADETCTGTDTESQLIQSVALLAELIHSDSFASFITSVHSVNIT